MEDHQIVDLYWAREEKAITESDRKYGKMLLSLSRSLLDNRQDAEECVNDTYLDAWGAMPTARPMYLGAFLSKITRRISVDRFRSLHRQKRGGMGEMLEELSDCIPDGGSVYAEYHNGLLSAALNRFLEGLEHTHRIIFMRRYFYSQEVKEIAKTLDLGESYVKTSLYRSREKLKKILEKEELL